MHAFDYYDLKTNNELAYENSRIRVNVTHHHGCMMCQGKPYRKQMNRKGRTQARSKLRNLRVLQKDDFIAIEKYLKSKVAM